jgi:YegS/Rv2252/BmrU family lipid kinase
MMNQLSFFNEDDMGMHDSHIRHSVILISNPASGRGAENSIKHALRHIESMGAFAEVLYTSRSGDATWLARKAIEKNPDLVLAAGGDGTVNEVANGMAGSDVPIAVLPIGTTNVLARELGIPFNIERAVEVALTLKPRPVSLGKVTAGGQERLFCFASGTGFDAATVFNLNKRLKKYTGRAAYVLSAIKTLASWSPAELSVTVDGERYTCCSLIASRTRKYAGSYVIAPEADITQPFINLLLFHGGRRLDMLRYSNALLRDRLSQATGVTCLKCRDVEVEGKAHIQVDGEYLGTSPASMTVVPEALRIVY